MQVTVYSEGLAAALPQFFSVTGISHFKPQLLRAEGGTPLALDQLGLGSSSGSL